MKRNLKKMTALMTKSFQTGMRVFVVVALLTAAASAQAQVLTHSVGKQGTALATNGMQVVHEYRQVIYATPGQAINLRRPDKASFFRYIRWYDYSTDRKAAGLTVSTAATVQTNYGLFYFENSNELIGQYTMPTDGRTHYIACDQSAYNDYVRNGDDVTEPTLSQRLVFEIRPASQMAALMDEATGTKWLEEHSFIAPTQNTLYIGPKYEFFNDAYYPNYFYDAANPTKMGGSSFNAVSNTETQSGTWNWTAQSVTGTSTSYKCITQCVKSSSTATVTARLTRPNNGWGSATSYTDNKQNTWTRPTSNNYRKFKIASVANRSFTNISVNVTNTKNSSQNVTLTVGTGRSTTFSVTNKATVTKSYTLNPIDNTITVELSNDNVTINYIELTYTEPSYTYYNVGDTRTTEPSSNKDCWEKQVVTSGSFTRKKQDRIITTNGGGWNWKADGATVASPTVSSGHFIQVSSNSAGTHTYELSYSTGSGSTKTVDSTEVWRGSYTTPYRYQNGDWVPQSIVYDMSSATRTSATATTNTTDNGTGKKYNVAKFTVKYMAKTEVGPVIDLNENNRLNQTQLVSERRFNETGGATYTNNGVVYHLTPVPAAESSYGFYWGKSNRSTSGYNNRAMKDEYALINSAKELSWYFAGDGRVTDGTELKNHTLPGDKSSDGYFMFVDGSERPGDIVNLTARANLCPGSKMFFSAYIADLSTKSTTAPNLDFVLLGVDAQGKEHALTTYTTGEFGSNGKDGNTSCGKWMRILFPFEFDDDNSYVHYKLKITGKGKNGNGNDFAIDDIQIFVQNPPVMPIQASSTGCPNQQGDAHTYAYLRVDYGAVQDHGNTFYYQWHDYAENNIDTIAYLNKMYSKDGYCGRVTLDANPATSGKVYGNIALFDQAVQSVATPRAMYGYILEKCADGETRYVLYIAQPITLRVGYKYYGYVASSTEELGPQNHCSSSAELLVAAGVTFKMGENIISSGETRTVCGSEPGTLQMVYRYVQRDLEGGILGVRELTNVTADWLFGEAAYIDANPEMYFGYTYSDIWSAIDHYRAGDADAEQTRLFNMLVKNGLLTPNTSSIEPNMVGVSGAETVTYTAFPIISSIHVDEDIRCAEPSTFSFNLGDAGANSVSIFINTIESWETLPAYVKMNPRRIRVSANHLQDGDPSLSFNIGLHGAQDQVYICNSAVLVSSTDPQASSRLTNNMIGLKFSGSVDEQTIDKYTNAVAITGASRLQGGYDYTFRFTKTRGAGYVPADECNEFNTFITLRVVPAIVTWEGSEGDAWNNDAFWDSFVPMADTKVILKDEDYIIPDNASAWGEAQRNDSYEAGAASYITYDINYRTFECEDLYVPAGATLVNQHRLTINGIVYYDLPTNAAKWTMCSFPIKGVVSGDMYIPTDEINDKTVNPFRVQTLGQTTGADASGRTTNKVYVSLYNAKDTVYGPSARTVEGTTWTTETNNLNISFSNPGYAVSIGADYTEDKVIRLPKPETEYKYYQYGAWVDQYATAIERPADYGKPSYQPTGEDGANGMNITVTNNTASDLFLIGNPTLAALDIEKFIEGNDNLAGAYYVSNMSSLGARKGSIISVVNGHPSVPGDYHILPVGGAALFQAKTSATSLTVNITPDMLVTSTGNTAATAAPRRVQAAPAADEMDDHSIYISARYNPVTSATCFTSYAVLSQGEEASDDVVDGEDAKTVMYDANKMRFAMYTIGGGKGLSVNQTSVDNDIVPLAVYSHTSMKTLYFVFQGNNDYLQEWDLVNLSDNSRTPLYDSIYVAIKTTANNGVLPLDGSVGYVLEHTRKTPSIATDIDETNSASAFGVYGTTGTLFAYSNDDMQDFCIYDASGRVVVAEKNAGRTAQYHLPTGVYMVRANGEIQKAIVK